MSELQQWWQELAMLRAAVDTALAWIDYGAEPSVAYYQLRKASDRALKFLEDHEAGR